MAQTVKNPPAMLESWVPFLGREDLLEKAQALERGSILDSGTTKGKYAQRRSHPQDMLTEVPKHGAPSLLHFLRPEESE